MQKLLSFKQKDITKNSYIGLLFIIFGTFLVLYLPVLTTYFSGDDFFHFKISQTDGSLFGFIKLFGIYPMNVRGYAFYRPLFREGLYNIFYSLFGLNSLPFRILQFVIHFTNITLVFILFKKLFKNKMIALLTSFIFALSAANVGSLYYLAGGIQAQGALLFTLLCLISFWEDNKILSFVFFVLALLSHELAISLPFLLLGLNWIKEKELKDFILTSFKSLWVYSLVTALFLYIVVFVIGTSQSEIQYHPNLNPKTLLNTLSWYIAWGMGIPEMLVDYLGGGFKLNPNLMTNWGEYFKFIFPAFFGFIAILVFSLKSFIKDSKLFKDRKFWFLCFWFIVGLLPVLFLPIHKKTYYLQISLPALGGIIAYVLHKQAKLIITASIVVFLVLNISSIKLADRTYWAAQRGRVAEKLIKDITTEYPTLPHNAILIIRNDPSYPFISKEWGGTSTQAYFALNDKDALQLLYKDKDLIVLYEDKDNVPNKFEDITYSFIARIN
jgi:hypothetical protein